MGLSCKERIFMVLLGVATASGLTVLVLLLVEATSVLLPAETKFGIVLDAGSSHTSLFVYQWPSDKEKDTGVVSQALACQVEGPGISSYALNPVRAGESLKDCLEEALALVPRGQHQETPTFLGATAGMRLLRQKNSSQAGDILEAVSQVLGRSPLDFRGAEVLAGQDEGAFGWITVNYLLGRLVQYSSGQWTQPAEGMLLGTLDMGGASTQICFAPSGPILDQSSQATFHLYGANYSVYTHSHLCFGRDQVLLRLLAGLLQSSPASLLRHPCYHSGYQTTLPLATLSESPCVRTAAPLDPTQNLTIEGTGNPGACVTALRGLFNFSCQDHGACAFDGVYQPPVQGQFYVSTGAPSLWARHHWPQDGPQEPWGAQGHRCGRHSFSHPVGILQLLLHLPLPEPHLQAAAGHCQCHGLEILPEALEAGGDQLPWAGALVARLLCLGPVHPHTAAGRLWLPRGELAQHRVPEAGRRDGHWLDAGLHAQPDWHDPSRGTR
ncbi:ectonucleoside triphosphate diphosphohydrolase 8 isoform X3 [Heterocephalus glaber]|uniref:Ectonucleoside triphosphate diphosphohydrolase 8 n=1 Tax=Heterocephalus glaber TaxID=10181 RepID=A0AAX6T8H1_HETGA|nr:ectonucleoside triphosphate diphosphohydrolase 8 isoform X3 [Heterocephalus glaber]